MSIKTIKPRLETALENAHSTLLHHIDENYVEPEDQIPRNIIEKSEAVIFLTELTNLDSSKSSNGILMFHLSKNNWGAPCSVYLEDTHDIKGGVNLHLAEKDYILFIQDSSTLHEFFQKGRLHFKNYGSKVHIMDGPLGRNTILEKNLSHDDKPLAGVLCYAISRNIITQNNSKTNPKDHYKWLENCEIVISKIDNKEFYRNKVVAEDIDKLENLENWYKGRVPIPDHDKYYFDLSNKLNEYLDQPSKLKAIAQDKIQKIREDITDRVIEHTKAELKTQAKEEIKNRIFGKDETEKIKDNMEVEKIKDGNVNDTRDVRLLKGAVKRVAKLVSNVWNDDDEEEQQQKGTDKHEKRFVDRQEQGKTQESLTMNNPDKITVPITEKDFPISNKNVHPSHENIQQKDA